MELICSKTIRVFTYLLKEGCLPYAPISITQILFCVIKICMRVSICPVIEWRDVTLGFRATACETFIGAQKGKRGCDNLRNVRVLHSSPFFLEKYLQNVSGLIGIIGYFLYYSILHPNDYSM